MNLHIWVDLGDLVQASGTFVSRSRENVSAFRERSVGSVNVSEFSLSWAGMFWRRNSSFQVSGKQQEGVEPSVDGGPTICPDGSDGAPAATGHLPFSTGNFPVEDSF